MPTHYIESRRGEFFTDDEGILSTHKDDESTLDYTFDWSDWLGSDTIATSTWTASGVTISTSSNTTTAATAWVQHTDGSIRNKIVTAGGRTAYRYLNFYGSRATGSW